MCGGFGFGLCVSQVELDVLKRVEHKHILALVGAGLREDKPRRFLVLEVRVGQDRIGLVPSR